MAKQLHWASFVVSVPVPVSVATNLIPVTLLAKIRIFFTHHDILYPQRETVEVSLWGFFFMAVVNYMSISR